MERPHLVVAPLPQQPGNPLVVLVEEVYVLRVAVQGHK